MRSAHTAMSARFVATACWSPSSWLLSATAGASSIRPTRSGRGGCSACGPKHHRAGHAAGDIVGFAPPLCLTTDEADRVVEATRAQSQPRSATDDGREHPLAAARPAHFLDDVDSSAGTIRLPLRCLERYTPAVRDAGRNAMPLPGPEAASSFAYAQDLAYSAIRNWIYDGREARRGHPRPRYRQAARDQPHAGARGDYPPCP